MHICFLTTGNIRHIATMKRAIGLANHMADLGWEVSIVAMDCSDNRAQIRQSCDARVILRTFDDSSAFLEVVQKTRILRSMSVDVLYLCSYSFRNRVWQPAVPRRMRMVVEHSELFSSIQGVSLMKRMIAAYFERLSLSVSDDIVCASQYLYDHYTRKKGVNGPRVHYLPYGYAESLKTDPPCLLEKLRKDYDGQYNVVYMGSLIRDYGLFLMLEAFRQLKGTKKSFYLHLLGSGPDEAAAKKFVQDNELSSHVGFAGYVPESHLSSWFHLADAFLAPLSDTVQDHARCPSKTYMYLAFGKPILTCRIGESAQLFEDPKLFFQPDNPTDLAARLQVLAESPDCILPPVSAHSWLERARSLSHMLLQPHG